MQRGEHLEDQNVDASINIKLSSKKLGQYGLELNLQVQNNGSCEQGTEFVVLMPGR
jgi:hypothetical protein